MGEEGFRDHRNYVTDPKWARDYSNYQKRYAVNPRESDKKLGRLVKLAVFETNLGRPPRILDIGCSTGNLLRYFRRLLPQAELVGGDLMAPVIERCRVAPDLADMSFEVMDIFALPTNRAFDVIACHAVTYLFDKQEFGVAMRSIAQALGRDGVFVGYELVFPGDQERCVIEKSNSHPNGLRLMLRSEDFVVSQMGEAGFADIEVQPFDIPIDLPRPGPADDPHNTYTVRDERTGRRLMFRGDLFQPWAHIVARKAG